jgi:hypothetical protein
MKKFLYLTMAAFVAGTVFTSCGDKTKEQGGGLEESTVKARITSYAATADSWTDVYTYEYAADGKVAKVKRAYYENDDLVPEKEFVFTYSGSTLTITDAMADDAVKYTITLGSNGMASAMTDEWEESYTYTYNSAGFITYIERGGSARSNVTIEDDCITLWTRFSDGEEQFKDQTFYDVKNVAQLHTIYSEQGGFSRWLAETGLFGKASAYMCASTKWQHSDANGTFTYDYDKNGLPTVENKDYPDYPEKGEFTWEILE